MLEIKDMTESEQVLAFKIEDELVANRTMDERDANTYAATCIERARGYADKVKTMTMPLYFRVWAVEMAAKHRTAIIRVHHNYLPWLDGFLVTRYGEAVESWPDATSEKDVERARYWKRKEMPESVTV